MADFGKTMLMALCLGGLVMPPRAAAQPVPATNAPPAGALVNLASPKDFQVYQRGTSDVGALGISGRIEYKGRIFPATNAVLEARVSARSVSARLPTEWQPLPFDPRVSAFRGALSLPAGGWYRLTVRLRDGTNELATATVEHVGIGEVFVIAGQSNSANHGAAKQQTATGMVASFDGVKWSLANDPQGGASGGGGSFMPAFGDALSGKYQVPIGLVPAGVGATSVRQWLMRGERIANLPTLTPNIVSTGPGQWECDGGLFDNLMGRIQALGPNGFRAVLWHQGESDANQQLADRTLSGRLYREYMEKIIRASHARAGWTYPWFVAQATYHTPDDPGSPEIRAAQKSLWDDGIAREGPDTDALTGPLRDRDGKGVHFSAAGLQAHGKLWAEKVGSYLDDVLKR